MILCRRQFQLLGFSSLQSRLFWFVISIFTVLQGSFGFLQSFYYYIYLVIDLSLIQALKGAAESLEKLMDVTREELPETMAAVRLSGMEISDLTMELSDLGLAL